MHSRFPLRAPVGSSSLFLVSYITCIAIYPVPQSEYRFGSPPNWFTFDSPLEATELEPFTEITTIAKLHRQIHERLKKEWISEWAKKPMTAISNRLPPSLAGSHAFRTLDRHTLGIVTQARTGHGHFGEYYQTHNIQEPTSYPCGAELHVNTQCLNARNTGSTTI
jgi:hypothetical protein